MTKLPNTCNIYVIQAYDGLVLKKQQVAEGFEELYELVTDAVPSEEEPHIDCFIDNHTLRTPELLYARFWFSLFRWPASLRAAFNAQLARYQLYCVHLGVAHRVTGCSRLGDVWLSRDFTREAGYDLRVPYTQCGDWSSTVPRVVWEEILP